LPILYALIQVVDLFQTRTILITSGSLGGLYHELGEDLVPILNRAFKGKVRFANRISAGSVENVQRIESGQADLGFAQDGLEAKSKVRAIVRLFGSPLQIVARSDSTFRSLDDLALAAKNRKLRLFLGAKGSGTRTISLLVLKHYGLSESQFEVQGDNWGFMDASKALQAGKLDVAFFLVAIDSPAVNELASNGSFTLLDLSRAEGIATEFPFLEKTIIPAGTYPSYQTFPERPVVSVESHEILICSSNLSSRIVYKIAEAIFTRSNEVVTKFALIAQVSQLDPDHNFYYILHPGALDFYRQHNTPPLVPWSMISLVASYISTLVGAIWLWIRRRRAHELFELLEEVHTQIRNARHSLKVSGTGILDAEANEIVDFVSEVRTEALRLYRRWKISSEAYGLVKETAVVCLEDLATVRSLPARIVDTRQSGSSTAGEPVASMSEARTRPKR
jgi:TRAP transporter TAXI family solute receptor